MLTLFNMLDAETMLKQTCNELVSSNRAQGNNHLREIAEPSSHGPLSLQETYQCLITTCHQHLTLNKKSQAELTNILVLQSASMLGLHLNIGSASQLFQQKLLAADIKAGGDFDRRCKNICDTSHC